MLNSKTHFEQVPIETVMRIAKVDIPEVEEIHTSAEKIKSLISGKLVRSPGPNHHDS